MTTTAEELRQAAQHIRDIAAKATPGPWLNLDQGDRIIRDREYKMVRYFVDGTAITDEEAPDYVVDEPLVANPDNADHIVLWDPVVAALVADMIDKWAWMVDSDPDLIYRCGGDETLALARAINARSTQ